MSRIARSSTPQEQEAIHLATNFLRERMTQRATLQWALESDPYQAIKRQAVRDVLSLMDGGLVEPWRSAWRLIEESWDDELGGDAALESHRNRRRLESGERTGALIRAITEQVRPRLSVSARPITTGQRAPRRVSDLVGGIVASHDLVETGAYELAGVEDQEFLESLAVALEGTIEQAVGLARRLSDGRELDTWRLGQLHWVGYREPYDDEAGRDVDDFHGGIAPAVKLLNATVQRIAQLDPQRAQPFLHRWRLTSTPIHLRLWSALAAEPQLASAKQVEDQLLSLDSTTFWDLNEYPELTELRARRFDELSEHAQGLLERRIRKGPPASHWSKRMTREQIETARHYWIARELRRIEVGGGHLSVKSVDWLAGVLPQFPELIAFERLQLDFPGDATFWHRGREDAIDYGTLEGSERLNALEKALGTPSHSWNDDPEQTASLWIRSDRNAEVVAHDLVSVAQDAPLYPKVIARLAWSFSLREEASGTDAPLATARQLLALISALPADTVRSTIDGLAYWLSSVAKPLKEDPGFVRSWFALWPFAVVATNARSRNESEPDLNEVVTASGGDGEREDLDTLNVPVGRLISAFLQMCPIVDGSSNPFAESGALGEMRDAILAAPAKAGLVGRHRFIEHLAYFLSADPAWTQTHLMSALKGNDGRSLALWRALSRRMPNHRILESIGELVAQRAIDPDLGRERRVVLLTSLVVDTLNALLQPRDPVVPHGRLQQTLRASDDEVRARTAQAVQRFLASATGQKAWGRELTPEHVFEAATAPFLQRVWPQERSLVTPGVAAAFADIPAAAGAEFAAAVDAVQRFLVPFSCWSLSDYGFWTGARADKVRPLSRIDSPQRAEALLKLLNTTIGSADDAVVPLDLNEALEQIESQAAALAQTPAFRRLATLSRRR